MTTRGQITPKDHQGRNVWTRNDWTRDERDERTVGLDLRRVG